MVNSLIIIVALLGGVANTSDKNYWHGYAATMVAYEGQRVPAANIRSPKQPTPTPSIGQSPPPKEALPKSPPPPIPKPELKIPLPKAEDSKHVLMLFTADWCAPCKLESDFIEGSEVADSIKKYYHIVYVNYDATDNKALVEKYQVTTLPTAIVLYKDTLMKSHQGWSGGNDFMDWLNDAGKYTQQTKRQPLRRR